MLAITLSLVGAVVLYGALILLFRAPPKALPKPDARCIVRNEPRWQAGRVRQ